MSNTDATPTNEEGEHDVRSKLDRYYQRFMNSDQVEVLELALTSKANKHLDRFTEADLPKVSEAAKKLDLTGHEVLALPDSISSMTRLRTIILDKNALNNIPKNLEKLTQLTDIHLRFNQLTKWPMEFYKFPNLQTVDLSYNQIKKFDFSRPQGIVLSFIRNTEPVNPIYKSLTNLDLSFNYLESFPKLMQCESLHSLNLARNDIITVPDVEKLADSLFILKLAECKISSFPLTICSLHNLTHLDLSNNSIKQLPPSQDYLMNMPNLKYLKMEKCDLQGWSQLCLNVKLEHLEFTHNCIEGIPREIQTLGQLKILKLGNNYIRYLPEHVQGFTNLTHLDLSKNRIEEIEECGLSELVQLVYLNLSDNRIKKLPSSMCNMVHLKDLNVSNNQIKEWFSFSKLKQLEKLSAVNNRLSNICGDLTGNDDLQHTLSDIDVTMNRIDNIHPDIYRLIGLVSLRLKHNAIEHVDEDISNLKNLVTLNLDNNELEFEAFPFQCIGKMNNLEKLYMNYNSECQVLPEAAAHHIMSRPNFELQHEFDTLSRISDNLFISSANAATNKRLLQNNNITHVVTVAKDVPPRHTKCFKYLVIYVDDAVKSSLRPHFYQVHDFIQEAHRNGTNALIHCMAGVSRSATVAIAYLMISQKMRGKIAYRTVKEARTIINPNTKFRTELTSFDKELYSEQVNIEPVATTATNNSNSSNNSTNDFNHSSSPVLRNMVVMVSDDQEIVIPESDVVIVPSITGVGGDHSLEPVTSLLLPIDNGLSMLDTSDVSAGGSSGSGSGRRKSSYVGARRNRVGKNMFESNVELHDVHCFNSQDSPAPHNDDLRKK
ncbi:hypothetical protein AKO1_010201 [Acrasis kona]|uniref:Uncharacterized protein n=1 Tax=Acrasis kona TaxID=1008807 RepID=A0AAW2ZQM3_9EUKA